MTSIEDCAFKGCTSLKSISFPIQWQALGRVPLEIALHWNPSPFPIQWQALGRVPLEIALHWNASPFPIQWLRFIGVPSKVALLWKASSFLLQWFEIHRSAFKGCTSLESITIPNLVTEIGSEAFADCSSLKSITIPNLVTSIEDCAFKGCTSLKSIIIPDSVTSIGEGAFRDCTSLKCITIPDSVTIIADGAFEGCTCLESITIPRSVTLIGDGPFDRCSSLKTVIILSSTYKSEHFLEGCDANLLYHWGTLYRKGVKECRGFPGWKNESWLAQPTHLHLRRWWSSPEWSTVLYDTVFSSLTIMAPIADPPGLLWHLQMEGFERPFQVKILSPASLKTWGGIFSLSLDRYGWKKWVIYIKIHLDFDVGIVGVVKVLGFLDDWLMEWMDGFRKRNKLFEP